MHLPVIVPRTYLSHSSVATWSNCQYSFWLKYLAGYDKVAIHHTYPAALGIAFDCFIKDHIANKRGIKEQHLDLNTMLSKINMKRGEPTVQEVISDARKLAEKYIRLGLTQPFYACSEVKLEYTAFKYIGGVPLYGIIDLLFDNVPLDFKLRGFRSVTKQYPTPGYRYRINESGIRDASDEKAVSMIENHRPDWAAQMLMYNIMLNTSGNKRFIIHELVSTAPNKWVMVEHAGTFTREFVDKTWKHIQYVWSMISQDNRLVDIEEPKPTKWMCEKYNSLCDVAHRCTAYKKTLGSRTMREIYG